MPQQKEDREITVRKPAFDFDAVPNHWVADSGFFTHFANSFFTLFPEGERFFIRSVNHFADQITDPKLREEVKAFAAQEVQHGKAHEDHFEVLRRQGYDVDTWLKLTKWFGTDLIQPLMERIWGKQMSLSATAAAEHFTAMGAQNGFESNNFEHLHPVMRQLAQWHAAEELEHKHVAFDVLKEIDPSYSTRIIGLFIATVMFFGMGTAGAFYFMAQDDEMDWFKLLRNLPRVAEFQRMQRKNAIGNFLDYLRPDFHPDDHDNRHYAKEYFASQAAPALAG